jgi:hypothetical protein
LFVDYWRQLMKTCPKCGVEVIKTTNAKQFCADCKPKYQARQTYSRDCVICGTHFETQKPNKVLCRREYCRIKLRRQNAMKSYYKIKAERKIEGDSTCPYCKKKFKGSFKWEYCSLHSWARNKSDYGCEFNVNF